APRRLAAVDAAGRDRLAAHVGRPDRLARAAGGGVPRQPRPVRGGRAPAQRRGQDPGLRDDRRWDVTADLAAAELTATELIAAHCSGELSPLLAHLAAPVPIRRPAPQGNAVR